MISIGVRVILIIFRTSRQSQGCVSGTMAIFALALLSVNAGSAEAGRISPSLSMASPAPTNGTCEPNERYKEGLAAFQRKVRFPYHGYCLPVFRVLLHMAGARTFSASSHSSLQFKWAMHEARRMIERQNEMDKVREARLCVCVVCVSCGLCFTCTDLLTITRTPATTFEQRTVTGGDSPRAGILIGGP